MNEFLKSLKEIQNWLDRYGINSYSLIPDKQYGYVVDAIGPVDLIKKNLSFIPVKFNEIDGDFACSHNHLTSLEFAPKKLSGFFDCTSNQLKTLEFSPQIVNGFYCYQNLLTSLKHAPQNVDGDFCVGHNKLLSLAHGPKIVKGSFLVNNNQLASLKYCPEIIEAMFDCSHNKIETLEYFPKKIIGDLSLSNNPKLGCAQNIGNFQELYNLHLETLIKLEKTKLTQTIEPAECVLTQKKYKI